MKQLMWVTIVSLLLEMIVSCFIPLNTDLFNGLFTLVSLVIICPYFTSKSTLYYKIAFITGLLYDIIASDTLFLNAIIFTGLAFIIYWIFETMSNQIFTAVFICVLVIAIYRVSSFMVLLFIGYLDWNASLLISSITSSLLLNIIYSVGLYFIVRYIAIKLHLVRLY